MGLVIKIKNIQSVNNFKLFYKVGRTPGSSSSQSSLSWGTQYTGSPSVGGIFNESVTTISIDLISQGIDLNPYNKQYWFKILDVVTGSYVIENIHIHEYEFYDRCIPKCDLGGTAVFLAPTPTPTYTIDCSLNGTAELTTIIPTPTPTITPTPTSTVGVTETPTITPTITSTPIITSPPTITPTPTSTVVVTETPTITPTPTSTEVTITVKYHGPTEPIGNFACNTGTDIQVVMDNTVFCNATTYISSYFNSIGTGTFWISYNGSYRQIYHGTGNSATQSDTCKTCVGVEPTYYYYAMGDCNDMRYSGTETTIFGFGAPVVVPVCMTSAQITQWYSTANFAQQTLSIDYDDPCGFGEGYSGVTVGRSTTELTEGTVYLVDNQCLSVISVNAQYVGEWGVDLDNKTPIGGSNPCGACDPPFTGYTLTGYSGVTCDTGENILAVTILGSLVVGKVYGIQLYNGNTPAGDARCMTINANLGPQLTITDPETNPYSGYHITDGGPFVLGQPMFQGYVDCPACNSVPKKYKIDGVRCDNASYSVTVWSDTLPTIGINDTFRVNDSFLSIFCWKVTAKDNYKTVVPQFTPEYSILDTGCSPCDGSLPSTPTPTEGDGGGGSGGGSGGYTS
jgi:hypothetical protein